jgi:hypothetical protein
MADENEDGTLSCCVCVPTGLSLVETEDIAADMTSLTWSFSVYYPAFSVCYAKHVKDKAAKWAKAKRPRKSRPSDINRAPIIYELHSLVKPAEYSISDEPAVLMAKPVAAVVASEE